MSERDNKSPFGPSNPHPLSKMKTELVWEGKYDEYGNRREIDMAGLAMPMQRIGTVSDAGYVYGRRGVHTICVKVVDTFGCDTSITLEVKV